MTIQGAIAELQNLLNANDVPFYYKGGIQKVIETISMELAEQNARLGALERKINLHEKAMAKAMTDHKGEPQTEVNCDRCKHKGVYSYCHYCDGSGESFEPKTEVKIESSWVGETYGHFDDEQSGKE